MESTTYTIKVVSTSLTHHLADAVIDVCRTHLDGSLPSLDEGVVKTTGCVEASDLEDFVRREHAKLLHP